MKSIILSQIISVFIACFSTYAQTDLKKAYASNPPNFLTLHYEEASAAVDIVEKLNLKPSSEYISQILFQIRNHNISNEGKIFAIYLLGCLCTTNSGAIQILIDNVDLKALHLDPALRIRRFGDYPAEEALLKIGQPSVYLILQDLPKETNAFRIHLLCDVLVRVESQKPNLNVVAGKSVAQKQIKDMLLDEKDSTRRINLTAALKELEK